MKIIYELNPPKIVSGNFIDLSQLSSDLKRMVDRANQIVGLVDGIHLTDSVLGIPRVSSITSAHLIKNALANNSSLKLACSVRARDRNYNSICQFAYDAILSGVTSLLILKGDEPADGKSSGLKPTTAIKMLQEEGYSKQIELNLSIPSKIRKEDGPVIQDKINSRPNAFVTQSIASLVDLSSIVDIAKSNGIKVIACIMVPHEKNKQSADMIKIDWKEYQDDPVEFVKQAGKMADEVLLTSPNSFASGLELLKELNDAD